MSITAPAGATSVNVKDDLQLAKALVPPFTASNFHWRSSNSSIAQVDPTTGDVTGVGVGKVTIFVDASTPPSQTVVSEGYTLQITDGILQSIELVSQSASVSVGATLPLVAMGHFESAGGKLYERPLSLTDGFTWIPPAAGSPVTLSTSGILTGIKPSGPFGVTGAFNGAAAVPPILAIPALPVTAPVTLSVVAATNALSGRPKLLSLTAGNMSFRVLPLAPSDILRLYAYDPGVYQQLQLTQKNADCSAYDQTLSTPVQFNTSTSSAAATSDSAQVPATFTPGTNVPFNLASALVGSEVYCLSETANVDGQTAWSMPLFVKDPNDYGLFQPYFVGGVQATNQLSSSGSSTAAEYLEVGFNSAYRPRETSADLVAAASGVTRKWTGFGTNVDIRLSPLPVSGQASTAEQSSLTTTVTSVQPSQLSSQQTVRSVVSVFARWKWPPFHQNDSFTLSPVVRAGFGSVLNSTTTATTGSSLVTTQFAQSFNFYGTGGRFALERFPLDPDEAPQMITQVLVTLAKDSNLPSYVCQLAPKPGLVNPYASATLVTACDQGQYAPLYTAPTTGGPGWTYYNYSRTVRPRVDVEGIVRLFDSGAVLGINLNFAQSVVGKRSNLDTLNEAGNVVRVYLGYSLGRSIFASKK